ncbi:hypothetical protein ADL27_26605, partial [Streptomyces sp. NRRL F-6602]
VTAGVRHGERRAHRLVTTWLPGWKRNGWRTSAGKPVANQELVVAIDTLLAGRDVTFVHVAAHQVGAAIAATGAGVTVPGTEERLEVKGLFSGAGISWLLENALVNFTGFPPLGTVLLMMMAVGVAERAGLLETAVRATIARAPVRVLPYVVAFVACQAHVMSD